MTSKLSTWVRQARHRAKRHRCLNRLALTDVAALLDAQKSCAYCDAAAATTVDQPFLISNGAPNVLANCLVCCQVCHNKKRNVDLIAWYNSRQINYRRLTKLIKELLTRDGHEELKSYLRRVTGLLPTEQPLSSG